MTLLYLRGAPAQSRAPFSFDGGELREGSQPAVALGAGAASYRSNGEHVARAGDLRGRPAGDSHRDYRAPIELARSMLKRISRPSQRYQEDLREVDRQRESARIKVTGWTIVRAVALGVSLAVVLNMLIGYLASFIE